MRKCFDKEPLISIVVPVYNKEIEHLKKCFTTLIGQSCNETEIIIVDDGSKEQVADYCKAISEKEQRVKYRRIAHRGVSRARNIGIEMTKSRYVMFVDADDWLDEDCCERALQESDNEDIIFFSYIKEYPHRREKVEKTDNPYRMSVMGTSCMKLYKRSVLGKTRFNESLENAEDVEFNFRVYDKANSFKMVAGHFYHYRIQANSTVRKYDNEIIEKYEKTISAIQKDLKSTSHNMYSSYIDFLGVVYLMIVLNHIVNSENNKEKNIQLKEVAKKNFTKELFLHSGKLSLPFTRKLPIILAKYKMYNLLYKIIAIKKIMDK